MEYYSDGIVKILNGDATEMLKTLSDESIHCCVTSPPYWGLRDYGVDGQIGLESTPEEYVEKLVAVFAEVWRVLRSDGTVWLNLGDSYAGSGDRSGNNGFNDGRKNRDKRYNAPTPAGLKPKDLVGIPWRVAFALQSFGWYLRQDIIWSKPNPMPESVKDRCTKSHEYIFLLSKSERYFYDAGAIAEPVAPSTIARLNKDIESQQGSLRVEARNGRPMKAVGNSSWKGSRFDTGKTEEHQLFRSQKGPRVTGNLPGRDDGGRNCNNPSQEYRNKRSVWTVSTVPFSGAHFAVFPPKLIEPCVLAGCPVGGTVLDPFGGSGVTAVVSKYLGRKCVSIELGEKYCNMQVGRLGQEALVLECD